VGNWGNNGKNSAFARELVQHASKMQKTIEASRQQKKHLRHVKGSDLGKFLSQTGLFDSLCMKRA